MKFLAVILILSQIAFAQIDSDAETHMWTAKQETISSFMFLGAGMFLVAGEDIFIKESIGPLSPAMIKIITGSIFGSLALYHAAKAANDVRWIGVKISREF